MSVRPFLKRSRARSARSAALAADGGSRWGPNTAFVGRGSFLLKTVFMAPLTFAMRTIWTGRCGLVFAVRTVEASPKAWAKSLLMTKKSMARVEPGDTHVSAFVAALMVPPRP